MSAVRWVAIAGVVVAVALAAPQTGAFTTMSADRGVTVAVADDEDAFLAIERPPVSVAQNRSSAASLLTVTNRFPTAVTVTATLPERAASAGTRVHNVTAPGSLDIGASGAVRADLTCADNTVTEQVTVSLRASGDGVLVTANRTVTVDCVGPAATPPAQASGRNHTAATSTARKRYDPRINSIVASVGSAR